METPTQPGLYWAWFQKEPKPFVVCVRGTAPFLSVYLFGDLKHTYEPSRHPSNAASFRFISKIEEPKDLGKNPSIIPPPPPPPPGVAVHS